MNAAVKSQAVPCNLRGAAGARLSREWSAIPPREILGANSAESAVSPWEGCGCGLRADSKGRTPFALGTVVARPIHAMQASRNQRIPSPLKRRRSRRREGSRRWTIAALVALVVGGVLFVMNRQASRMISVPQLSAAAEAGREAFGRNCAGCHGEHARGTMLGPPLIHSTYRPGDHPDATFERAVRLGVRAHHWNRGHMPPQPAVTPAETGAITRYIRELQQANGIQ